MSDFRIIDLPSFTDARGNLTVMQSVLPFEIRRVFWITGADGHTRGGHRHHQTRQALIAVSGTVLVPMNDGRKRADIVLDGPSRCLIVEPDDWHLMRFQTGSALLVFASHEYDAKDYIDEEY